MRLVVTRPQEEAERTAVTLRALGHTAFVAPMLRIETIPGAAIPGKDFAAVLVTSANAIHAIALHPARRMLASRPLFAVGERSAQAAREAGFSNVVSADGDGGDLAMLAARTLGQEARDLLYLAGNDRARDLPGELLRHGLHVDVAVVYRADPATALPGEVRDALAAGQVDGVLHYSRRTAANFVACVSEARLMEAAGAATHYCLSPRVAEPLTAKRWRTRIARQPDEAALIELLGSA